ncbi:MAG: IclR family transcriptional regulator [Desulfomonile tiedjei]|uniref:IclR family transcriptional regulator n=1 Tax=Desulfomonile tiedjei TaxID=2358 RepID=A0A9D6V3E9_9BACT|nr:IclR family transcriptional regulator [Desulfomonile tiedjei]
MVGKQSSSHMAYSAPIVSKAMRVLKMIITAPTNPGISEIASKLSLAKSTTHGILAALEESGWVLRDPISRKYTCGHAVRDLAGNANVRIPLVELARPYLEKLGQELDEDIFLGIWTGPQLLILDQVESSKGFKIRAKPGTRISIFAGAAGKIFLAHHDPPAVAKLVRSNPIPSFTKWSVTDPEAYLADLERVRAAGVARDKHEYLPNVWAVAVPIFYGRKARKRMVAGFWVVSLDTEMSTEKMDHAEHLGRITGEALSRTVSNLNDSN